MSTPTQLATAKPTTVLACINDKGFLAELAKAIRTGVPVGTMARIVLTQVRKNPKLTDPRTDPRSFMAAVLTGCQLGLEFGREAHLVPFDNRKTSVIEVQLIPDYKGLIQLVLRSGQVQTLLAENVWTGEEFAYRPADPIPIRHQPLAPSKRGAYVGTYAECWMKGATIPFAEWMWAEEVWKVRDRSASGKIKAGPWFHADDQWEMTKKTCLKRLTKHLPMSAELKRAIELDTAAEIGETQDFVDVEVVASARADVETVTEALAQPLPPSIGSEIADGIRTALASDQSSGVEPIRPRKGNAKSPLDDLRAKIRKAVADFGAGGEEVVCDAGLDGMQEVGETGDIGLLTAALAAIQKEQLRILEANKANAPKQPAPPPPIRRTGPGGKLFDTQGPTNEPPMRN